MTDKLSDARRLLDEARQRVALAERQLEEVAREAALLIPAEPKGAEVVRFSLRLDSNHHSYEFAAIRVNGKWYTTGRQVQAHGVSWSELVRWIRNHHVGSFTFVHVLNGPSAGAAIRIDTP